MTSDTGIKLRQIFRDVFDDDTLQFSDDLSPESLAAWDSLGHIRLISAIEDELSLSFTLEEIESMTSFAKVVSVVTSKG